MFIRKIFFIIALVAYLAAEIAGTQYDDNIVFYVYPPSGPPVKYRDNDTLSSLGCPVGLWAMIVHGWKNGPLTSSWIPALTVNLNKYRGGCVIAMDFFFYSKDPSYGTLVSHFPGISAVMLKKVKQMLAEGFTPENGYMFGFSYGAHLAFDVGTKLNGKIDKIDVCDPAGPGFDNAKEEPKLSGKNVQCVHTSVDFGTTARKCHQNWLMGNCGVSQPAVGTYTSHGLCPHFYNSAFENDFNAENNLMQCTANIGIICKYFPCPFKMGYMETRRSPQYTGTFFSRTYKTSTYTAF